MRAISQAKFYKSYYISAHKLPENERHIFYDALLDYIFEEKIPADLPFTVDLLLTSIMPFVDADLNRKNGGAPKGNNNAQKQPKKQLVDFKLNSTNKTTVENNLKTINKTNNVNVNDNVNVNVNEDENDNEIFSPSPLTPSQTEYSKQVFNVFSLAGLPCARNNEISFMQTDFANAMRFIHSTPELKNVHSDDVIQACKNYVEVLKDNSCYITNKMNFFSLVKSKLFYNLLPANYDIANYKNFINSDTSEKKEEQEKDENGQVKLFEVCPKCQQKKIWYSNALQKFTCDNCRHRMTWEEFYPNSNNDFSFLEG